LQRTRSKVRAAFYLDNDVSAHLGTRLRVLGHQVTLTRDLQQPRAHDEVQLLTAAELGASLVTHNYKDFLLLHRAWDLWRARWQITELHPSIFVLPHGPDQHLAEYIGAFLARGLPGLGNLYRYTPRVGLWSRE
jgi:hypothetical protein